MKLLYWPGPLGHSGIGIPHPCGSSLWMPPAGPHTFGALLLRLLFRWAFQDRKTLGSAQRLGVFCVLQSR